MPSSGKRKTTMAKLARERRLMERRLDKQARKAARKQSAGDDSVDHTDTALPDDQTADQSSTDLASEEVDLRRL